MRVGHAVGWNEAVAVEVVVWWVVGVIIAPISIDGSSFSILSVQTLVNKIPDEATLIFWIFAHQVPILFKATARVAHSVRILALYQRFSDVGVRGIFFTVFVRIIHGAEDVGVGTQPSALPMYGAWRVGLSYPFVCSGKVGAVNGLVTHRPVDDAGVVEIGHHVVLVAL